MRLSSNQEAKSSADSSPTKSPKEAAFLPTTNNALNFNATGFMPGKRHGSPVKLPPHSTAYVPSFQQALPLPAAYDAETALPNIEDVNQEVSSATTSGWQIPAVHNHPPAAEPVELPSAPILAPISKPSPHKPGAAAKVGRRQAWLKFMAYEGSVQICLDALLNSEAAPATGFLVNGCQELKEALSLGMLLLPETGLNGNESHIYWDDREEGGGAVLERITIPTEHHFDHDPIKHHLSPPRNRDNSTTPASALSAAAVGMTPLQAAHQGAASLANGAMSLNCGDSLSNPTIEATCVRVVGCPMLSTGDANNRLRRSQSTRDRKLAVCIHVAGVSSAEESHSWTRVSPSGAIESPSGVLRLPQRGTILVEFYQNDVQVAAGTVQAAELQRCALQHDAFDDEAPMASGFLRNLMPAFGKRKNDTSSMIGQGITTSSMIWVRLVDTDGADAGHVVVAAKIVTTESATTSVGPRTNSASSVAATPSAVRSSHAGGRAAAALLPPPPNSATSNALATADDYAVDYQYSKPAYKTNTNNPLYQDPRSNETVLIDVRGAGVGGRGQTAGGYLHVTSQHVFDVLLEAALSAAKCGPKNLKLTGPWSWLVDQHAQRYGVRKQYTTLAHLRWVVKSDNAAPTDNCLGTIAQRLGPLLDERDSVALTSAELALLGHVLERVDQLLVSCFENYFALDETTPGGMAEGMLSVRPQGAPPAFTPAVALLEMTRGTEQGTDGGLAWLASRLRSAARKRFQALLAATEARRVSDRRRGGPEMLEAGSNVAAGSNEVDDPHMSFAYGRVEELCNCVINELRADESIAAAGIIPEALSLPSATAVEYIRGTISYLHHVLKHYPPPAPTPAAVRLVESVGRLQSFVERHGFENAAARLNSRNIFGRFVGEWVEGTATALRRILRALDRAGPPTISGWADIQSGVKTRVSPLVEGMLSEVESQMRKYARIVAYWPVYGQELEASLVSVLREATRAANGHCGLVHSKAENAGNQSGSRIAWRWIQVGSLSNVSDAPPALRRGIGPHQALLLNSLRRLLAVVPQLELALRSWCAGSGAGANPRASVAALGNAASAEDRLSRDAPDLGAHFAQLIKEVRTTYSACTTLTAETLAGELAKASPTSVIGVLRREALTAAPAAVAKSMRNVFDQTVANLRWLAAALDGRVFVALARGLWDNAARDILRFAEDLNDGGVNGAAQGAWKARQGSSAALRALDAFYRTELAAAMGSDLLDKDLVPPQHAQRAAALLADNTVEVNMSFDVY